MVALDDLDCVELTRRLAAEAHHQDRSDGEVGNHETWTLRAPHGRQLVQSFRGEPGGSYHCSHPQVPPGREVLEHHIRMSGLDEHIG
jgi:hypothetical protein